MAAAAVLTLVAVACPTPSARADGDPGSDVLVYQTLFLEADAGISVGQQAQLGALLSQARRAGFPIRVAIIASRYDLGAVTALWGQPRAYARFLGLELSQAYTGRLLVVMPDGFGFNWPGHGSSSAYLALSRIAVHAARGGLADVAARGIRSLALQAGIKLGAPPAARGGSPPPSRTVSPSPTQPASGSSVDTLVATVAAALASLAVLGLIVRRLLTRGRLGRRMQAASTRRLLAPAAALGALVIAGTAVGVAALRGTDRGGPQRGLAANPVLDPGTTIAGPAPNFRLTDQFGQSVSLRSFRGKVVLLAFNDSECTTICPLTTTAMLDAKAMLGRAGRQVQLVGVDANPRATSLQDVLSYSELHGMLHAWHFLTGSLPQLRRVWRDYKIEAAVQGGQIAHTPALFVIDRHGRFAKVFVTQQSYAAVGQLGELLAQAASNLLPGHPAVRRRYGYSQITGVPPTSGVTLPEANGGRLRLEPGQPRLLLFFATWDRQVTGLASGLVGLTPYTRLTASRRLPKLVAVDEASVEPPGALGQLLSALPSKLSYPVAVDRTGRVADGYEVEGLPWLVLVSAEGRIAWYYSVAALGWPSAATLTADVKTALTRAASSQTAAGLQAQLRGSPPALGSLHRQTAELLGGRSAFQARLRSLHGYPVVINFWASWCGPCRSEFGLFASAASRFGRRIAFLGADTSDSAGDAQVFLHQHPVSYPSYQTSLSGVDWLLPQGLAGIPTTVFLNRSGRLVYVHTGQYDSQGTLDADIMRYVLDG